MTNYFFVNPGDDHRGPPAGGRRLTSSKSGAGAAAAAAGAPEAFDTSAIDAMLYAKDPSRR